MNSTVSLRNVFGMNFMLAPLRAGLRVVQSFPTPDPVGALDGAGEVDERPARSPVDQVPQFLNSFIRQRLALGRGGVHGLETLYLSQVETSWLHSRLAMRAGLNKALSLHWVDAFAPPAQPLNHIADDPRRWKRRAT